MAVEAMPLAVQLIHHTACLSFFFFFSYLDSGQFCQSWCLHCPEWLCLSGCGHGALDLLTLSLSLYFPPGSLTSLYFSPTPPLPLCSIFSSFIPLCFAPQPLLHNLPFPLWSFAALPEVLWPNSKQCHIRHCQTYGGMVCAKDGWLHLSSKVPTKHNW